MTRDLPSAVKQDLIGPQHGIFLHLMEIRHDVLPAPLRYTDDGVDTVFGGNVYTPQPFGWVMPEVGEQGAPKAAMQIANVDQTLIQTLRNLIGSGRVTAWIGYFIASDLTAPFMDIPNMRVATVDVKGEDTLVLNLTGRFFDNEPSPSTRMNGAQYPGLYP